MITSPVLEPEVEPEVEKKTVNISEPRPPSPLRRKPRTFLEEILKGHEDFLGYTPD